MLHSSLPGLLCTDPIMPFHCPREPLPTKHGVGAEKALSLSLLLAAEPVRLILAAIVAYRLLYDNAQHRSGVMVRMEAPSTYLCSTIPHAGCSCHVLALVVLCSKSLFVLSGCMPAECRRGRKKG